MQKCRIILLQGFLLQHNQPANHFVLISIKNFHIVYSFTNSIERDFCGWIRNIIFFVNKTTGSFKNSHREWARNILEAYRA